MKLITLMLIAFLFSGSLTGCYRQPHPEVILPPEHVYIESATVTLRNKKRINISVPSFELPKLENPNDRATFIVQKQDVKKASNNNVSLRRIIYLQDRDIKFYVYQNNKVNKIKD